jgi:hypothetical protein
MGRSGSSRICAVPWLQRRSAPGVRRGKRVWGRASKRPGEFPGSSTRARAASAQPVKLVRTGVRALGNVGGLHRRRERRRPERRAGEYRVAISAGSRAPDGQSCIDEPSHPGRTAGDRSSRGSGCRRWRARRGPRHPRVPDLSQGDRGMPWWHGAPGPPSRPSDPAPEGRRRAPRGSRQRLRALQRVDGEPGPKRSGTRGRPAHVAIAARPRGPDPGTRST